MSIFSAFSSYQKILKGFEHYSGVMKRTAEARFFWPCSTMCLVVGFNNGLQNRNNGLQNRRLSTGEACYNEHVRKTAVRRHNLSNRLGNRSN